MTSCNDGLDTTGTSRPVRRPVAGDGGGCGLLPAIAVAHPSTNATDVQPSATYETRGTAKWWMANQTSGSAVGDGAAWEASAMLSKEDLGEGWAGGGGAVGAEMGGAGVQAVNQQRQLGAELKAGCAWHSASGSGLAVGRLAGAPVGHDDLGHGFQ